MWKSEIIFLREYDRVTLKNYYDEKQKLQIDFLDFHGTLYSIWNFSRQSEKTIFWK